jgi:hypothetical protein
VTGQVTTRLVEGLWASAQSKQRCLPAGFARHVRESARADPAAHYPRVVLVLDHAPWHRGALVTQALKECSPRELDRLPSSRPQLQVIERFWRVWRRRATHKRLFLTLAQLTHALRHSLG